jgi:hypothetical protein
MFLTKKFLKVTGTHTVSKRLVGGGVHTYILEQKYAK